MVKLVNTKQTKEVSSWWTSLGGGLEVEKLIADSWVKYQTFHMDDGLPRFGSVVTVRIIPIYSSAME